MLGRLHVLRVDSALRMLAHGVAVACVGGAISFQLSAFSSPARPGCDSDLAGGGGADGDSRVGGGTLDCRLPTVDCLVTATRGLRRAPAPSSRRLRLTDVCAGRCRVVCGSGCRNGTGFRVDARCRARYPWIARYACASSCVGRPPPHGCWRRALPWRVSLWLPSRYGLPGGFPLLRPASRGLPGTRFDGWLTPARWGWQNDVTGTSRNRSSFLRRGRGRGSPLQKNAPHRDAGAEGGGSEGVDRPGS